MIGRLSSFILLAFLLAAPLLCAQESTASRNVTLHLTDVDIRDFLNLIHEVSGRNIVIDPDVRGRVTAMMNDVPADRALEAVLKSNGLEGTLLDNVYRVTRERAAPLEICTYTLSNAKASEVARIVDPFLSPRGRIAADMRTNTLIISDIPAVLRTLGLSSVPPSRGRCFMAGHR